MFSKFKQKENPRMGVKYKGYGNHGKWQDYMPSGRNSNSYSEILKVGGKYGKR